MEKYNDQEMLYGIEVAREGSTTDAGAVAGNSAIDSALIGFGAGSFEGMRFVIYPGDPARVDSFDIPTGGFNNVTGEISLAHNYKGGQIPAGAPYAIVTSRAAITEVHGVFTVLPSCPGTVEPDTAQDFSISISTVEGIPAAAALTAGTITITRVRAGVETVIVNAAACSVADGRIYYDYTFPSASWQAGDEYKAVFSGQAVDVAATTYNLADIRCKGNVSGSGVVASSGHGLCYHGVVTQVDDATHFRVAAFAGLFEDEYFSNNYRVYVVWDAAGGGAAPQGEQQACTGYSDANAIFTHGAFTVNLAVDDEVLIIHERIAQILDLITRIGDPTGDTLASLAAKWGDIARDLDTILGARWDLAGDLGTDIATIIGLLDTGEAAGPYTYTNAGGEQDVYEDTATTRRKCSISIDLSTMTQDGTIRIYRKVDGANYQIWIEQPFKAVDPEKVFTKTEFVINQHWKLTYQESADEGADRSIPYNVITEVKE